MVGNCDELGYHHLIYEIDIINMNDIITGALRDFWVERLLPFLRDQVALISHNILVDFNQTTAMVRRGCRPMVWWAPDGEAGLLLDSLHTERCSTKALLSSLDSFLQILACVNVHPLISSAVEAAKEDLYEVLEEVNCPTMMLTCRDNCPNEKPGGLAANVYKWVGNCSDTFFHFRFSQRLTFWQELWIRGTEECTPWFPSRGDYRATRKLFLFPLSGWSQRRSRCRHISCNHEACDRLLPEIRQYSCFTQTFNSSISAALPWRARPTHPGRAWEARHWLWPEKSQLWQLPHLLGHQVQLWAEFPSVFRWFNLIAFWPWTLMSLRFFFRHSADKAASRSFWAIFHLIIIV